MCLTRGLHAVGLDKAGHSNFGMSTPLAFRNHYSSTEQANCKRNDDGKLLHVRTYGHLWCESV